MLNLLSHPLFSRLLLTFLFFVASGSLFWKIAAATSEDDTPVELAPLAGADPDEGTRPWQPPKYSDQENALGHSAGAFAIPPRMEERVSFWIDIYSRYTTHQGLLHDSRYVNIVYESVDFTDIQAREDLSPREKTRARRKRLKEAKKKVKDRLRRLSKLSSPAGLEGEELRYWYLFSLV